MRKALQVSHNHRFKIPVAVNNLGGPKAILRLKRNSAPEWNAARGGMKRICVALSGLEKCWAFIPGRCPGLYCGALSALQGGAGRRHGAMLGRRSFRTGSFQTGINSALWKRMRPLGAAGLH
jgi:hypothetical protein